MTAIEILSLGTSHADIFSAIHKRVFLSGEVEPNTQNLLQKGLRVLQSVKKLVDVTGIEPVTACLQSSGRNQI